MRNAVVLLQRRLRHLKPSLALDFTRTSTLDSRITFSRGTTATLFDSTGALVYAKHNLLLQSQTFQTTWTVLNSSVSADSAVAPDGTTTADKLVENTANSEHYIEQSATILSSGSCTASVYIKADTRTKARVVFVVGGAGGVFADADLTAGTIGAATAFSGGTAISSAIHNMGNGWYRCVVTGIGPAGTAGALRVELLNAAGNRTYTGDGTSGLFIWGAQLNQTPMEGGVTSSLSTYYPTVASAYYAPRFDYNPSTLAAQGLLIEEQRTNSIRNNTMQGAVAGTPGTSPTNWTISTTNAELVSSVIGTGTESGITYIDVRISGTMTASRDLDIGFEVSNNIAALNAQTWAESVYLREVGGSQTNISAIYLQANTYTAASAYVNSPWFAAKTVTTAALATQRFSESQTLSGATIAFIQPLIKVRTAASGAVDFTLRIGLPQLEQGAFATSVIPTTTTALTRNADVASMTGTNFSSWFNASEGAMVVQGSGINNTAASLFAMDDGTTSERIINIFNGATTQIAFRVVDGGADQANFAAGNITALSQFKLASAYKVNDFAAVVNNGTVQTDISGTLPTVTTARIGCNVVSGAQINGYIQRISYYPVRLPNSTLQALTA